MDLVNQHVIHSSLGRGMIIAQDSNYITVEFASKTSKFDYTRPDTFSKYLRVEDDLVHAAIMQEFADQSRRVEEARVAAELAKQREEAARTKERSTVVAPEKTRASAKPTGPKRVRVSGTPLTFYVFQGGTFDIESRGGFIWAPQHGNSGNHVFHWENMLLVKSGDIILHGCDAKVVAVSTAISDCYECSRPKEREFEESWNNEGWRVDLQYIVFDNPIRTSDYVNDILEYCKAKYSPFDKYGNGNMGYLYELHRELARVFLNAALKTNPYLADIDFIQELLS